MKIQAIKSVLIVCSFVFLFPALTFNVLSATSEAVPMSHTSPVLLARMTDWLYTNADNDGRVSPGDVLL